jgi:hypothetical protein
MDFMNKIISKVFAFFFAFLFFAVTILAMLSFNLNHLVLQPSIYESALQNFKVYQKLPTLLSQEIVFLLSNPGNPALTEPQNQSSENDQTDPGAAEIPGYLKMLNQQDYEKVVLALLPSDKPQMMMESLIRQVLSLLNGETTSISLSWIDAKNQLAGQPGVDLVFLIMDSKPACTAEQIIELSRTTEVNLDKIMVCNPPNEIRPLITPQIKNALAQISESFPDETSFNLSDLQSEKKSSPDTQPLVYVSSTPLQVIKGVRLAMRLSSALALFLLFSLTLLEVRSIRDLMVWWGVPFFVIGISGLGLASVTLPFTHWFFQTFILSRIQAFLVPVIVETGQQVIQYVAGKYSQWLVIESGMFLILGVTAFITMLKLKRKP